MASWMATGLLATAAEMALLTTSLREEMLLTEAMLVFRRSASTCGKEEA